MKTETLRMDWQQVALHGGPPCFHVDHESPDRYCGRAQRWDGHDHDHKYVSLDDLLNAERERCAKILEDRVLALKEVKHPTSHNTWEQLDLVDLAAKIRGKQ